MPKKSSSFRQTLSSLVIPSSSTSSKKKKTYTRFISSSESKSSSSKSTSNQHILQSSDNSDDDDNNYYDYNSDESAIPSFPTPIDEYDGKEPLRGIISDFGDVHITPTNNNHTTFKPSTTTNINYTTNTTNNSKKPFLSTNNNNSSKKFKHSSSDELITMDIIGAKTIDESRVNYNQQQDDNNHHSNKNKKKNINNETTIESSKQFTSCYNVNGEGHSDIRHHHHHFKSTTSTKNNQKSPLLENDDADDHHSFIGGGRRSFDGNLLLTRSSTTTIRNHLHHGISMSRSGSLNGDFGDFGTELGGRSRGIVQSASLESIAPGYTITKKASFKILPNVIGNLVGEDDSNLENNVFFDLEKPKKGDGKERKKLKKRLIAFLYKASIFSLLFFLLSIFVFFTVSTVNSSDDSGYYTNGSPTTLLWISGLDLLLVLTIIFELFTSLLFLRLFSCLKGSSTKSENNSYLGNTHINIDSYFGIFIFRILFFLLFTILNLINFTCYSLFIESRDHLAGWLAAYALVPLLAFLTISYNQYSVFKNQQLNGNLDTSINGNHNLMVISSLDFHDVIDHQNCFQYFQSLFSSCCHSSSSSYHSMSYGDTSKNGHSEYGNFHFKNCCWIFTSLFIKLISLIAFCCIGAVLILFTIQSIALVGDHLEMKQPGTLYKIQTVDHHQYNIHMVCRGNVKSRNVILLDADIGIPSPYEYMLPLLNSLTTKSTNSTTNSTTTEMDSMDVRACIIERGGYGFSDTGPLPRDGNNTLNELVSTIYESRLHIPFLYIAHSSSTFTARALAQLYPELLSGMLLLHPCHEDQEEILLKQLKNLTSEEIQLRKDTRDYIDDVIRYVNPLALPRLFKYFHFEFLLEYEDPYELYYMNGWKTYYDNLLNSTSSGSGSSASTASSDGSGSASSISRRVIFQNKYTGCVWSELKHFQTDTADSIRYLRSLQSGSGSGSSNIPTIIMTAGNLLNGDCESNHFVEGSNMCQNYLKWREGRANAIRTIHSDLAELYGAEWVVVESSYDLPIDVPHTITRYAKQLLLKSNNRR